MFGSKTQRETLLQSLMEKEVAEAQAVRAHASAAEKENLNRRTSGWVPTPCRAGGGGRAHDSLREQSDAYKAQVVMNALSGSALRFIEDEAAGNTDAVASPEMVFAKLFDRFLDPSAAMAAAGQLFRLRIDDFIGDEGAPEATEAAEHFWRAHDNCLLLAGKVFGRNAAPKCIALFLSMPQEVQARLRETEVVKRCQALTIMGDAARERW